MVTSSFGDPSTVAQNVIGRSGDVEAKQLSAIS